MNILLLVCLMSLVTFIPRLIPAFFVGEKKLNNNVENFLNLIPYTAMASLIFPSIIYVDGERWYIGVIGGAVAIILSYFKVPLTVVIVASVLVVMLLYLVQ